MEADETRQLLIEIRDLQRESLSEYRRVTQRSLDLQQQAVTRQEQISKLYRRVIVAGLALIIVIILLVIYLLEKLPY